MSSPPFKFGLSPFGTGAVSTPGLTATQLSIYNGACMAIGERTLQPASPGADYSTENRESRRALDDVWNRGGVKACLAAGLWNFAARGIQWNYDPDYTASFGYQCAFQLPQDWVRWMFVCVDPYMAAPLLQYADEGSMFYCDLQMLWVKYVSTDPAFGMNLSRWPDNFQRFVEFYFAEQIAIRVTGDEAKRASAEKRRDEALKKAKSTDAMNESTAMIPPGQWRQARHGRRQSLERGNPYSFYG
jgi:hypothetical protein